MSLTTNEGIAYVLSTPEFCLMKPFFYSCMTIHETSSMKVLHTIDWSWYDEDLKMPMDQVFTISSYEATMTWGTYHRAYKKNLILFNLHMFDKKTKEHQWF